MSYGERLTQLGFTIPEPQRCTLVIFSRLRRELGSIDRIGAWTLVSG